MRGGAEFAARPGAPKPGPDLATFVFDGLTRLHAALDRVYKLGASLPDAPLARFRAKVAGLTRSTDAERLIVRRIGQGEFRAGHIKPWAVSDTDDERLDVFNDRLLTPNLDAEIDRGLITVADGSEEGERDDRSDS